MAKSTPPREPLAIIGIGCRFPGDSDSPDAFWKMMCAGTDAIGEIPPDRWNIHSYFDPVPGKFGKSISKWGGFIKDIDKFDPAFFSISPREADWMDPQQRLLLEACSEALDDAGQDVNALRGSPTGVFVGISTTDYSDLQAAPGERITADVYTATGGTISIAANRVSYCFDFQGPSISMDTACSSALTAVHVACRSLWNGDCNLALVAGVNAILGPVPYVAFSRMSMLSPDGRCKAFDASANGFVRGEGVGAIALKPLSAALAAGDRIYALIRGTAANQDGRTNGLTVPSPIAQEALVRRACRDAGVLPSEIKYVEAHGTGTPVGDPIEAHALGSALSDGRAENTPCLMGSVKTNIGHLEAAAGIAGIIKLALVLKNGVLPPNLHFKNPNPHVDFNKLKLRIVQKLEPFPNGSGAMLAGINSFGFGGSNAHAILEAPPVVRTKRPSTPAKSSPKSFILPLSARTSEALHAVAQNYVALLAPESPKNGLAIDLPSLYHASAVRRTHHAHRLCVVADARESLLKKLETFAAGEHAPGIVSGNVIANTHPRPVFIFSGQGPQWWGMGRELLKSEPVFREKIAECDALFREFGDWSLLEELGRSESKSRLEETSIAQPAIFAIQVALAAVWKSWGIEPAAVVGHSVGEVAAAHVAGIMDLREAAHVIFQRGRCMDLAPERGRMLAVGIEPAIAEQFVARYPGRVSLAAYNSPNSLTLSGDAAALSEIAATLEQQGLFNRFLHVNYAFHSNRMDPIKDELLRALKELKLTKAQLPIFSTVTGKLTDGLDFNAAYWWRNVREPVHFSTVLSSLIEQGHRVFLELSAHPVMLVSISECLARQSAHGVVAPSLRRQEPERESLLASFGILHNAGMAVDWNKLCPATGAFTRLPAYPWQREKYWNEPVLTRAMRLERPPHPFFMRSLRGSDPAWVTWLDQENMPWLSEHRVQGHIVFPGAGYLETAISLGQKLFESKTIRIEEMEFQKALFLPENKDVVTMECAFDQTDSSIRFSSKTEQPDATWTLNAIGKLQSVPDERPAAPVDIAAIQERCSDRTIIPSQVYGGYDSVGLSYGPAFQQVESIWRRDGEALGRICVPDILKADLENYTVHPALLDACFHIHGFCIPIDSPLAVKMMLPVFLERLRFFARPGNVVWVHAQITRMSTRFAEWNIQVLDEAGYLLIDLQGFRSQAMSRSRHARSDNPEEWLYESRWKLKPLKDAAPAADNCAFIKASNAIAQDARQAVGLRQPTGLTGKRFGKLESELNALAILYIAEGLQSSGSKWLVGRKLSEVSLAKSLKVIPEQQTALQHLLSMLETSGLLARSGSGWVVKRMPRGDAASLWAKLLGEFPAALPELNLLRRSGASLAGLLAGKVDAKNGFTPEGSLSLLEHFDQDSITSQGPHLAAADAIAAALDQRPVDRTVRILEIGGGTGGFTTYLLPKLPSERVEYTFTDSDESSATKAEQKFFEYPFMQYQRLDITATPDAKNFKRGSYDVVIFSAGLNSQPDPRAALENARRLIAPGGLLVLVDRFRAPLWHDFVFGLAGEKQPLNSSQCLSLLAGAGFNSAESDALPSAADSAGRHLVIARAPLAADSPPAKPLIVAPNAKPVTWLVLADRSGVAREVAELLAQRGDVVLQVFGGKKFQRVAPGHYELPADDAAGLAKIIAEASANAAKPLAGFVHLWGLDFPSSSELSMDGLAQAEASGCHNILHLLQGMPQAGGDPLQLWLVTRGARSVREGEPTACAQGPIVGMGRAILTEFRHLRCRLVDLTPGGAPDDALCLFREMTAAEPETEIAIREGARHVDRLVRTSLEAHAPAKSGALPYRLEIPSPGVIDQLLFREIRRRKPGPEEVEIEICAAALNFRDVMKALGIYPIETDLDTMPGDECSGRIVAVGKKVKGFKIGDEVIANGPGCFASHITIPAVLVVKKPARITFEEAVTIPVTFMTAWHALHHLGRIRAGEKVLIQAATGGVGLAAIQIAQLAGAEIFATAGNAEKRDFLRGLGIRHVMDSRTVAFADEVRAITKGRGVDLVLNSLAGKAIAKGLSVLAPHGRFLEIGKRDIYQNTAIGLRPFRYNQSLFVIDMGQVMFQQSDEARHMLKRIMALFEAGKLHPLPHRALPISRAVTAFRLMAQARHVGKIVLSMQHDRVNPVRLAPKEDVHLRGKASYLITGGLGGFGLAVAKWLVDRGARHLVLTGRSGAATPEAKRAVKDLKRAGAKVLVVKADVSQNADVERIFKMLAWRMPLLKGIFHAAMVLDDGVLPQLTPARFSKVMAPKVAGTWNLHQASAGLPLEHFVMFSSISSFVGSAGQGNYIAANSFMDTLAHYRRSLGLPALAVNWGALSDVGFVARNEKVAEHLTAHGVLGIVPAVATGMLGRLMQGDAAQIGFMRVDWQKFGASGSNAFSAPRFGEVIQFTAHEKTDGGGELRALILAAPASERLALVVAQIREPVAKVLRTSAAKLDPERPLREMGLDSLMAFELLNRIEGQFGISLPPNKLTSAGTINGIAGVVLELLAGGSGKTAEPTAAGSKAVAKPDTELHAALDRVVTLRAEGLGAPLFFIHPAGGFVSLYENLVPHLAPGAPVYAIQSRAYFEESGEHASLNAMAREYADLISERQPSGPCRLAGFSLGGLFALATASELERRGRQVDLVGMIDTPVSMLDPDCPPERALTELITEMYDYFVGELSLMKPLAPEDLNASVAGLVNKMVPVGAAEQTRLIMDWLAERGLSFSGSSDTMLKQFIAASCQHAILVQGLKLKPVNASVRLWRGGSPSAPVAGHGLGAGDFVEEVLGGRHYELMHPPLVETLASRIDAALLGAEK